MSSSSILGYMILIALHLGLGHYKLIDPTSVTLRHVKDWIHYLVKTNICRRRAIGRKFQAYGDFNHQWMVLRLLYLPDKIYRVLIGSIDT